MTLQELKKQMRIIRPPMKALLSKSLKSSLTTDEALQLQQLENNYNRLSAQIPLAEEEFIRENHGEEKLSKWKERKELISRPYIRASQTGKRVQELDNELQEIIKQIATE